MQASPGVDTDLALLAASAAGDRRAFACFYRRHLPAVVGFLMRRSGDRELAGELAAEVFATALLAAGRYRAEFDTALPWLCGIARYKLSESQRRGRAEDRARCRLGIPEGRLDDQDLLRVEELAGEGTELLELLDRLPAVQREALWARVVQERGYDEIATTSGASEAAVRQRVSRALARLRRLAGQEGVT
ncbi:MAG TPA: RNA polymerase sigma factor [Solirubrobacteraceae bacterium]|nr:RNA polymerase sigma factor [Solirubrobacteraceae bacterium]